MGAHRLPFSQDVADEILERLAAGESIRAICKSDHIPSIPTIYKWLAENTDFAKQYARAREDQADTLADEILAIAEDETKAADTRRMMIDSRKWYAGKLRPKKYGEKQTTELTGPDGASVFSGLDWKRVTPDV